MKLSLCLAALASLALAGCFANSDQADCEGAPEAGCAPLVPLPAGTSCGGATCDVPPPACPAGEVPLIDESGCYTSGCITPASCDVAPACNALNTEAQCAERADCDAIYGGVNCRDPEGNACDGNGEASSCTCEAFVFARCAVAAA